MAAITSGIAKICVGGLTELEIKEKYDRIEDALNAARAAIQEGVVPGGGCTFLRIANNFPSETIGQQIMKKALVSPFYQILENIGLSNKAFQEDIVRQVLETSQKVYDARNKVVTEALESGIIDPVKVTRTALENAVSIASLLSTAGGAIIYVPDKK
jgi:chaperonin GroEL